MKRPTQVSWQTARTTRVRSREKPRPRRDRKGADHTAQLTR
jgi:hypothetical protein